MYDNGMTVVESKTEIATAFAEDIKITVVGSGYVGLANALALSAICKVTILDIDAKRVKLINEKICPIDDTGMIDFMETQTLNLYATTNKEEAYEEADYIIVATPTDYDPIQNYFNTNSVEQVIADSSFINPHALKVIKSTIPVGFTKKMNTTFNLEYSDGHENIIFSPEFLREGTALHDVRNPDRIVVGSKCDAARRFGSLLVAATALESDRYINVLYMGSEEAEAVKLFANSYLAMRVAYFNELDTYAEYHKLNTKDIINGVRADHRIGPEYCSPSFGYGGYCFPKDTKQLLANFKEHRIPNRLIGSIVYSNEVRKDWVSNRILQTNPNIVGIYRLLFKEGSDNYRDSAIQGVIDRLKTQVKVIVFEPRCRDKKFQDCIVESDLEKFKELSDVIVTNRVDDGLLDVLNKVYTRDVGFINMETE